MRKVVAGSALTLSGIAIPSAAPMIWPTVPHWVAYSVLGLGLCAFFTGMALLAPDIYNWFRRIFVKRRATNAPMPTYMPILDFCIEAERALKKVMSGEVRYDMMDNNVDALGRAMTQAVLGGQFKLRGRLAETRQSISLPINAIDVPRDYLSKTKINLLAYPRGGENRHFNTNLFDEYPLYFDLEVERRGALRWLEERGAVEFEKFYSNPQA